MVSYAPLDGALMSAGIPSNYFEIDPSIRSPDILEDETSHSWHSGHSTRTNPFFMNHNPFPQTFCLPGIAPVTTEESEMVFSSPLSGVNSLVYTTGSMNLTRQPSTVFSSYSGLNQSPALPSQSTYSTHGTPSHAPLLPALSAAPDFDRLAGLVDTAPAFDILPLSGTPKPILQKKNTRVDIPPERTLQNIDELIRNAQNEEHIKELKRQKRLLRNRKAALDSRIRKRQYTSKLEEDKDDLKDEVQNLQEQLARLHHEASEMSRELKQTRQERDDLLQRLRGARIEQEEMVRRHTLETANLRKKLQFLSNRVPQTSCATPVLSEPVTFTSFFDPSSMTIPGYEGLMGFDSSLGLLPSTMPDNSWPEFQPAVDVVTAPSPCSVASKPKMVESSDSSQSASGLLWLLLLCGAFVATKSTGNSAPSIPQMPEEVRAASASVLDSIFQDAGVPTMTSGVAGANPSGVAKFVSSVSDALSTKTSIVNFSSAGADSTIIKEEPLDLFGSNYLQPSMAQETEHLFSITPAQYTSIHSTATSQSGSVGRGRSPKRRSLTEALNAMRANRRDGSSENLNGGLLWNSIPAHVIREFRRMVDDDSVTPKLEVPNPLAMT